MRLALASLLACSPDPGADSDAAAPPLEVPALSITEHAQLPTVLEARWRQERDIERCWISYGPVGEAPLPTPTTACPAGDRSQLLLGLPADSEIEAQLNLEQEGASVSGPLVAARTGPLPDPLLEPSLEVLDAEGTGLRGWLLLAIEAWEGAYYDGPYYQIILDQQGRVVWARPLPDGLSSSFPCVSRSGDHIVAERVDRFGLAGGLPGVIERFHLDLTSRSETELPGLRFAWAEAEDGSIYHFDREREGEAWLSRTSPEGVRERLFDCVSWMAERCSESWCCEANAVVLAPERGSVLMSLWATDTVLEIELDTSTVRHSWGRLEGSWETQPPEALFELQHYPNFTPEGTLLVGTQLATRPLEHRFREYRLDEPQQRLEELRSWGEDWDLFAQYQGEALRLANGNTLMNFGSAGAIREVDPDGELVWSLSWPEPWMLGHMCPIEDLYALLPAPVETSIDTPTSSGSGSNATPKRSSTP